MISGLFSIQIERHVLSAFLRHPEIFPDIDSFICEYDFVHQSHQIIFTVIRNILVSGEKLDKVLVAQKIKNLNIVLKDNLDVFAYLDSLSQSQITAQAGIEACKELLRLRICREICDTADKVKEFISKNKDQKIDVLISESDKIYNEKILQYNLTEDPVDLYEGIENLIDERSQQPVADIGLITQFSEYNRLFGGFRSGNGIYVFASRAKSGKSTLLLNFADGLVTVNANTEVLYLDTEMETDVSQFRAVSAITGISTWHLETGNWLKNQLLVNKFNNTREQLKTKKGKIFHLKVANRPVEQICSIARRWYFKKIGRNSKTNLVLIYDYLKLTGEKVSESFKEYQILGEKTNELNELGNKLKVPILSAIQLNRSAEDGRDDSAAVAMSDRISWFAASVNIFRKKRLEEIAEDGVEFGTHKLVPIVSRFLGKEGPNNLDFVNVSVGKEKPKYKSNFINYDVNNFKIEEKGTLVDIVKKQREQYELEDHSDDNDNASI